MSFEVDVAEHSVVGHVVVSGGGFEVVVVGEGGGVRVAQVKRHELVPVVDSVQFFSVEELLDVLLHNRVLSNCTLLSSSSVETNNITESEDVLEFLVLESVFIDIDSSVSLSDS